MRPVIACGYDGSDESRSALEAARRLHGEGPAVVIHVHANGAAPSVAGAPGAGLPLALPDEVLVAIEREARRIAEEGMQLARRLGLDAEAVIADGRGNVHEALLEVARERGAAAIVVGSRGRGSVKAAILGSVSTALVRAAERPALVAPRAGPH